MNKKKKKDTVGGVSSKLIQKEPYSRDPIELEREMHKEYENNIFRCIENNKNKFLGDFYLVVITKKEPLMPNVLRNYYFTRHSCPTPDYDQTLYRYNKSHESIELLWVIPSRQACNLLKDHSLEVVPEERELLNFVLDFADGTLMKIAKHLNKEESNGRRNQRTSVGKYNTDC